MGQYEAAGAVHASHCVDEAGAGSPEYAVQLAAGRTSYVMEFTQRTERSLTLPHRPPSDAGEQGPQGPTSQRGTAQPLLSQGRMTELGCVVEHSVNGTTAEELAVSMQVSMRDREPPHVATLKPLTPLAKQRDGVPGTMT